MTNQAIPENNYNSGCILIHRKIMENKSYSRGFVYFGVMCWLVLNANWKPKFHKGEECKRGQIFTGRKELSKIWGMTEQNTRTILTNLVYDGFITIQPTNKGTVITVCNYDTYQLFPQRTNQPINQQSTSNQPATNQRLTTTELKRIKEIKEINNIYNPPAGDNVDENNFSLSDCELPMEIEKSKFEKRFDIVKSRIHKLYSRRDSTEWSKDEIKKLKEICKRPDCDLELADIEKFYAYCEKQYWKQNIVTLLNQWGNEVDRARLKNSCAFNQTGNDGFPKLKVSI